MATTIYWTMLEKEWLRAEEPVSIKKRFFDIYPNLKTDPLFFCPAFKNFYNNLYGLKFIYDYKFRIMEDRVESKDYDQEFFSEHIHLRNLDSRFFSFVHAYIFFTEKEVEMIAHLPPFLENNDAAKKTHSVIGKFNIGKWFRPIEFPIFFKKEYDEISLKKGDIYTYVHFDTHDEIIFKRFYPTDKIMKFAKDATSTTSGMRLGTKSMNEYYNKFVIKKQILKEIRENILD
jgi:hypothetical protein